MMKQQRYDQILSHLNQKGYLTVDDAVELLQTSRSTVSRDFNDLAKNELVIRTHGGIGLPKRSDFRNLPYALRQIKNMDEKEAIARAAVALLHERDTLFLDGGTTTLQVASFLPARGLTVVTNSLHHASQIIENQKPDAPVEVFIAGGLVYAPWHVNIGPQTRYCLEQYHATWAFFSAKGIDKDGVYNHNELIVESERTMISNADKVVLLADHTKFSERSVFFLCELKEIDILITDEHPKSKALLKDIAKLGVEVITVKDE
ncbi:MAG: DeoR/GlpR family DNA-binding transcription regulator [Candidatus Hinthialibacter antarcticus]|nr:DeoR/GlpR family DNA-binding transcription regulator [Candidatus Hinthialibacter antarcticus]